MEDLRVERICILYLYSRGLEYAVMRRPSLVAVVLGVLVSAPASQVQVRSEPFVPIGVSYAGEQHAWRRDLRAIKSRGFNTIWTSLPWVAAERERGSYQLEALEQLLTVTDEIGLRVVLQLDTEAMPAWLAGRYPDAALVSDRGVVADPAIAGVCLDHDGVRADLAAFSSAVADRAGQHASLYAVDVWSAPRVVTPALADASGAFCFCPHTRGRFRQWLKTKYRSIDDVNAAWVGTFSTWNDVDPPRHAAATTTAPLADWKTFIAAKLRDDLRFKAEVTRRTRVPVASHTEAPSIAGSPLSPAGHADDWWMNAVVDRYGMALRPHDVSVAGAARIAAMFDGIRSAAGEKGWWLTPVPAADGRELRFWGWAATARGARAVAFTGSHPLDDPASPLKAAGEFASVLVRNPALFAPLRPRAARVGILYNAQSHLAGGAVDRHSAAAMRSLFGFHRAMFERNIATDFVHPEEIAAGSAARYGVLFLGYPLVLGGDVVEALKAYVEQGGTLIAEALVPEGLDTVFGSRRKLLRAPDVVGMVMDRRLDAELTSMADVTVPGTGYAEHLETLFPATRVLARFPAFDDRSPDPAITLSRYGKGRAIRIGTFPAVAFESDPVRSRLAGELLQRLVEVAGVTPDVRITDGGGEVDARFLESRDALVLIAVNHGRTAQRATLTFPAGMKREFWQNMETGEMVTLAEGTPGPSLTHEFGPRDVLVLTIRIRGPYDR